MTVERDSQEADYLGLSSDTKPTTGINPGIQFYETDTGKTYIWDGATWDLKSGAGGLLGTVGGSIVRVDAEVTRPADTTAYAAGDVIANSTSAPALGVLAGAARVNGGSGYIVGLRMTTNQKSITPRIRVVFYNASNPNLEDDNAPEVTKYADTAKRVGSWDLAALATPADTTNSDTSQVSDYTMRIPFVAAGGSTSLYFKLVTLDGFTPTSSEKFTLTVKVDQN